MHLFYTAERPGATFSFNEEESRHCIRVLRLKAGDRLHLTDGKGNLFECAITGDHPKHCIVEVLNVTEHWNRRNYHLHVAIAPTKSIDRFEWFLEKATEIGIDEITPLFCHNSERTHLKTERLQKILVAAMKQSLQAYLPVLNDPVEFSAFAGKSFTGEKFIAWCEPNETVELKKIYKKGSEVTILIGPEGDFTPGEVGLAKENGFIPVSLGPNRLRTETAGIVACHTIALMSQAG
jgi:16S rRNA (uracil1498-N3)-methyltransferase